MKFRSCGSEGEEAVFGAEGPLIESRKSKKEAVPEVAKLLDDRNVFLFFSFDRNVSRPFSLEKRLKKEKGPKNRKNKLTKN